MLIILFIPIVLYMIIPDVRNTENSTPELSQEVAEDAIIDIPQTDEVEIQEVTMNNFLKESAHSPKLNLVVLEETNNHTIEYYSKWDYFLISIDNSPFFQKRILAEKAFLNKLEINKEEACRLDVRVATPRHINPEEAGKEYGLSFCE